MKSDRIKNFFFSLKEKTPLKMSLNCTRSKNKDDSDRHQFLKAQLNKSSKYDIQLTNLHLTDEDIPFIIQKLIKKKKFQTLSFSSNEITSKGIQLIISSLKSNHQLTHLIFSSNPIDDSSIQSICHLIKSSRNLNHLSLSDTNISDHGIEMLIETLISNSTSLRSIDLRSNKLITDLSIDSLIKLVEKNEILSACRLDNCSLSEQGKDQLKQIKSIKW